MTNRERRKILAKTKRLRIRKQQRERLGDVIKYKGARYRRVTAQSASIEELQSSSKWLHSMATDHIPRLTAPGLTADKVDKKLDSILDKLEPVLDDVQDLLKDLGGKFK